MTMTKDELHAYILIWSANGDFKVTPEEQVVLTSRIEPALKERMEELFKSDSDLERPKRIKAALKELKYSQDEIDSLIEEMKEIFQADSEFSIIEKVLLIGLQNLFNTI